jgi:hypothetical protein
MKEDMAHGVRVKTVKTLTTLGMFDCSNQRMMVINLTDWHPVREPLGTSGLKEGAVGAVGE